jgi:hypothetical protein
MTMSLPRYVPFLKVVRLLQLIYRTSPLTRLRNNAERVGEGYGAGQS